MKLLVTMIAAFACPAGLVFGQSILATHNPAPSTNAAAGSAVPKRIAVAEAEQHYDETVVVTGRVAQVSIRPTMVYLNFEKPYPSNTFTAVIFAKATNQFSNLSKLADKQVEVSGKVVKYHGKPELILANSNQLVVARQNAGTDKGGKN